MDKRKEERLYVRPEVTVVELQIRGLLLQNSVEGRTRGNRLDSDNTWDEETWSVDDE